MEKMMILQECSALNERTIPTNEGTKVVESFEVVFTDMIDTVMGETGRTLTVQPLLIISRQHTQQFAMLSTSHGHALNSAQRYAVMLVMK